MKNTNKTKLPTMIDASIPVMFLIVLLTASVSTFGDSSSYGPNQIALLASMGIAIIIGLKNGFTHHDILWITDPVA